jgi:hypothetical protein
MVKIYMEGPEGPYLTNVERYLLGYDDVDYNNYDDDGLVNRSINKLIPITQIEATVKPLTPYRLSVNFGKEIRHCSKDVICYKQSNTTTFVL